MPRHRVAWFLVGLVAACGRLQFDVQQLMPDGSVPSDGSVPIEGLIHHWTLDEDPQLGSANDSVGSAHGAITGTLSSISGPVRQAMMHAGDVGDDIRIGPLPSIEDVSAVSITGWFKRATTSAHVVVGNRAAGSGTGINFYSDGYVFFDLGINGGAEEAYTYLPDTDWHHAALVFDGSRSGNAERLKGYIDGQLVVLTYQGTIPSVTHAGGTMFRIGQLPGSGPSNGAFDDVRIYDRALTPEQVMALSQP